LKQFFQPVNNLLMVAFTRIDVA